MSLLNQPSASSDAIVLRTWPTGETSTLASVLTAEHGYVGLVARGARRPRSPLGPLLQPGRRVHLEFSLRAGRPWQYLRTGALIQDPLAAAGDLPKAAFLLAGVELIEHGRPSGVGSRSLFDLCATYLDRLPAVCAGGEAALYYAFELALLELQGLAPTLDSCAGCGAGLVAAAADAGLFSHASGGLLCASCARAATPSSAMRLSAGVPSALRLLADWPPERGLPEPLPRPISRQIGIALHRFLGYHWPGYRLPAALQLLRPPAGAGSGEPTSRQGERDPGS